MQVESDRISLSGVTRFVVDCPTLLEIAAGDVEVAAGHQLVAPALVRSQALAALYQAARRGEFRRRSTQRVRRINSLKVRFLVTKCSSSALASQSSSVGTRLTMPSSSP